MLFESIPRRYSKSHVFEYVIIMAERGRCFLASFLDGSLLTKIVGSSVVSQPLHSLGPVVQTDLSIQSQAWRLHSIPRQDGRRVYTLAESLHALTDDQVPSWATVELPSSALNMLATLAQDPRRLNIADQAIVDGLTLSSNPEGRKPVLYTTSCLASVSGQAPIGNRILEWLKDFLQQNPDCIYVRQTQAGKKLMNDNLFQEMGPEYKPWAYPGWYAVSENFLRQTTSSEVIIVLPPSPYVVAPESTLMYLEYALILANPAIQRVRFLRLHEDATQPHGFSYVLGPPQDKGSLQDDVSGHRHLYRSQRQPSWAA